MLYWHRSYRVVVCVYNRLIQTAVRYFKRFHLKMLIFDARFTDEVLKLPYLQVPNLMAVKCRSQ